MLLALTATRFRGAPGDSRGHLINSTDKDLFLPGFLKLLEFYSAAGVWEFGVGPGLVSLVTLASGARLVERS